MIEKFDRSKFEKTVKKKKGEHMKVVTVFRLDQLFKKKTSIGSQPRSPQLRTFMRVKTMIPYELPQMNTALKNKHIQSPKSGDTNEIQGLQSLFS